MINPQVEIEEFNPLEIGFDGLRVKKYWKFTYML